VIVIATTRLIPLHANKGKTIAQTLADRTDYAENPGKTNDGELVVGYACDPHVADEQFLLSKKDHIRQAFKPGEITPREALEVGYELASHFTKNKHAFIVCVHTERKHIHSHVIFNSTTLDCRRKFKNFWGSAFAVRRLSNLICAEHGPVGYRKSEAVTRKLRRLARRF
jgi:hypothetical protein